MSQNISWLLVSKGRNNSTLESIYAEKAKREVIRHSQNAE